jgi:hypothetical protein
MFGWISVAGDFTTIVDDQPGMNFQGLSNPLRQ